MGTLKGELWPRDEDESDGAYMHNHAVRLLIDVYGENADIDKIAREWNVDRECLLTEAWLAYCGEGYSPSDALKVQIEGHHASLAKMRELGMIP